MTSVPSELLAAGWIPFITVSVLILVFSLLYIRCYQHRSDKDFCASLASILGLAVALVTCVLVPVDIFLVSLMKDVDGNFKSWAKDSDAREFIQENVLYAYYALYGCMLVFIFFILPFAYFFYEEQDDESEINLRSKCFSAVRYSLIFLFIFVILFLIGAFVPFADTNQGNGTINASDWEKFARIFRQLDSSHAENAVSFTISALTFVGLLTVVLYTSGGMTMWPIDLIKGRRSLSREAAEVSEQRAALRANIQTIRQHSSDGRLSSRDRRRLTDLDEQDQAMERRARHLSNAARSCCRRICIKLLRPFEIIIGILLFLIGLVVFLTLLLTNIDKIINSLGVRSGYALLSPHLPNLIDIILVSAQKVFPVDYVLMSALLMYLFFCSMAGIKHLGVWFCWIRMYRIRRGSTRPQALLFLCFLLMFIVLALNVIIHQLAPQYVTFGSQQYLANVTLIGSNHTHSELVLCTFSAVPADCTVTRLSVLMFRFLHKLWLFGVLYYWLIWAFLLAFLLSFTISVIRKRRSYIEEELDEGEFNGGEGDDEPLMH